MIVTRYASISDLHSPIFLVQKLVKEYHIQKQLLARVFGLVKCGLAKRMVQKATCLLNLRFLDVVALSPFAIKLHPTSDDCRSVAIKLRPFSNNSRPTISPFAIKLHPSRPMIAIPNLCLRSRARMIAGRYN